MSSPYAYEPLCAVPPVVDQQLRFALLLELKHALNAARGAVASVTGRAAGFLRRLATRLHLPVPMGWLRRAAGQLRSSVPAVSRSLGRSGGVAVAVAVLSSPAARSTLRPVVCGAGAAAFWAASALARLADRTLRLFGQPGQQAAEQLPDRANPNDQEPCVVGESRPELSQLPRSCSTWRRPTPTACSPTGPTTGKASCA